MSELIYLGYGLFLMILLMINFLYFFQVFKYRLQGDISLNVLAVHITLIILIVSIGTFLAAIQ